VRASKRKKRASIKEREEPKLDSVLDFLYYDNRRVALLIAQFDDFGLLQQIERTETTAESATDKARMSANIGPRSLSLQTGIDRGTEETGTDSSKRVYDPFWVIPLSFRDYLEERGLLRNNLNTARIGQIVVVRGRLTILDMGLLKSLWRIPEAKENAMQSALQNPGQDASNVERTVNMFFQIADTLPHDVQCIFSTTNTNKVWALLRDEHITGSSSDLALRYGMGIDGEWSLLGIVDALPGDQEESQLTRQAAVAAIENNAIAGEIAKIAEVARAMGRPQNAYGVTPLLIFREIT
jgi:hypothetical protein